MSRRIIMTKRRRELLDFLVDFIRGRRYAPSLKEMAKAMSIRSTATIHKHLVGLKRLGYITWDARRSRSVRIVRADQPGACPLCGHNLDEPEDSSAQRI